LKSRIGPVNFGRAIPSW